MMTIREFARLVDMDEEVVARILPTEKAQEERSDSAHIREMALGYLD